MINKGKEIKFDLHSHTNISDGKHEAEKMIISAMKAGMDVVAITDHNSALHGLDPAEVYKKYKITLIPGFEISLKRGHFLVLGIEPEKAEAKLKEWKLRAKKVAIKVKKNEMREMLEWSVKNGGLVIAAHPCILTGLMSVKKKVLEDYYKNGLVHGAEVHNDELERRSPKKLYNLWHRSTKKYLAKLGIPVYSNSDAHSAKRMARRFNSMIIDDPKNIIEVLKTGKTEIKHHERIIKKKKISLKDKILKRKS